MSKYTRMPKILTLCIIYKPPKILLGMKKRGFGAGRWNGFGGKLSDGETIEEAAKRELREEAGVLTQAIERVGILEFCWRNGVRGGERAEDGEAHLFKAADYEGELRESEEMRSQWFEVDEIPFEQMWQDDQYWMPLFLAGKKFRGRFIFDAADNILEKEVVEVEGFNKRKSYRGD